MYMRCFGETKMASKNENGIGHLRALVPWLMMMMMMMMQRDVMPQEASNKTKQSKVSSAHAPKGLKQSKVFSAHGPNKPKENNVSSAHGPSIGLKIGRAH